MKGLSWTALCGLVAVLQLCSSAKPNGGKFSRITQVLEAPASGKDADKVREKARAGQEGMAYVALSLYERVWLRQTRLWHVPDVGGF